MFLLHNFRPFLINQMILVSIKTRFPNVCRVSKFKNRKNTSLESVSRFVTSVSIRTRVLTRFTAARKHQAFSSWGICLCSLCVCFSLLYTLRTRFPWYFRIPSGMDHQALSLRVLSSCLSFIFLSVPWKHCWSQHCVACSKGWDMTRGWRNVFRRTTRPCANVHMSSVLFDLSSDCTCETVACGRCICPHLPSIAKEFTFQQAKKAALK